MTCLYNRRFFFTGNGYIGIGPACMQEDDSVCIISGAAVPFILRKRDDCHLLAGEAYVHGVMHGEPSQEKVTNLTEFRLR